jgi:hypothetical protein
VQGEQHEEARQAEADEVLELVGLREPGRRGRAVVAVEAPEMDREPDERSAGRDDPRRTPWGRPGGRGKLIEAISDETVRRTLKKTI